MFKFNLMKIRSLNNATTYFKSNNSNILFDPWIFGNLYEGAWSPYETPKNYDFLSEITHVFVSHLHQDHYDLETFDKISRKAKIFVPNMKFNSVIKSKLENKGFNVNYLDFGVFHKISSEFEVKIIPPLNSLGQDNEPYIKGYEMNASAIDTSFLVKSNESDSLHLLLCDNSPYDYEELSFLNNFIGSENISTMWYPYNGYAQDYPLCYRNLDNNQKKLKSNNMNMKREKALIKAIEKFKPSYVFPHSSDFILNGKYSDLFKEIHNDEFMDRYKYSQRLNKILKNTNSDVISEYALTADEIEITDNKINIIRNQFESTANQSSNVINPIRKYDVEIADLEKLVFKSAGAMFERCNRYNISLNEISDWIFCINITDFKKAYYISFDSKKVSSDEQIDTKSLTLFIEKDRLLNLLYRNEHWNNAQIGSYLTWERKPDEFNLNLYSAINFFHS